MGTTTPRKLCVIPGDGIGREVTAVALEVLQAAANDIQAESAAAGWQTFCDQGDSVPAETLDTIRECGAALFGAVSSPAKKVHGYQSAILKIRQTLDLYANIRPVRGRWSSQDRDHIDLVLVRENTEGLYAGREQMQKDWAVAEKLVSRSASERSGRMAAESANVNGMSRVTIVHKANVLPLSEGLFRDAARQAIEHHPAEVQINEGLVDIVAHNLVAQPEKFEVLVTTNMFGDILSDLAAWWCGGMGRAPSLNLGDQVAVAEPVHGSAPDIAGQGIADPTATILSIALLCRYHWNDPVLAERLEQATIKAIEQFSTQPITTRGFTDAVLHALANSPKDASEGFLKSADGR